MPIGKTPSMDTKIAKRTFFLAIFGALIIFAEGSALAPFIYTLF